MQQITGKWQLWCISAALIHKNRTRMTTLAITPCMPKEKIIQSSEMYIFYNFIFIQEISCKNSLTDLSI